MTRLSLLLAVALSAHLPSQSYTWDLPPVSAVEFDRTTKAFRVDVPPNLDGALQEVVLPRAHQGRQRWSYFRAPIGKLPAGWSSPEFDDSAWPEGVGRFGTDLADASVETEWKSGELLLRATVDFGRRKPKAVVFEFDHDDGIEIWWNGTQVVQRARTGRNIAITISGRDLAPWDRRENVICVRCTNSAGYGVLDVGATAFQRLPAGVVGGKALTTWLSEKRKQANKIRGDAFSGFRAPPLLFSGELEEGQRIRMPPNDLRDLSLWIATDLGVGVDSANYRRELVRVQRFGDIALKGKLRGQNTAGWQEMEVDFRCVEPLPRKSESGYMSRYVIPFSRLGFDGQLKIRRKLVVDRLTRKGQVTEFEAVLTGTLRGRKDPKTPGFPIVLEEAWRRRDIRQRDGEFRTRVAASIQKGLEYLKSRLNEPGHRDIGPSTGGNRSYPSGRLAIALLALLHGGENRDDPVVQKALSALRRRELVDTYSLGNAIMALEAQYSPQGEYQDLLQGVISRPRKRTVSEEDLKILQRWTDKIMANRDTSVDKAYLLRFNYVGGRRFDNSVNQYGLLGLYSAHLCGVQLSPQVWQAAANHLLECQCRPGRRIALRLARDEGSGAGTGTVAGAVPSRASGWFYYGRGNDGSPSPSYGSMTCAGLTGLTICQAALRDYDLTRGALFAKIDRSRNDGFAWLADNLQVRYNPGYVGHKDHWIYYYLYGLERTCVLSGVATMNDRDWYFEGAMMLTGLQSQDGTWPVEGRGDDVIERTAMAILFLKKASLPVYTGK